MRRVAIILLGACTCILTTRQVQAQATTVQLPTFNFFTVTTSVSVPDRGGTSLGGINRSSDGRNEFGAPLSPLGNRAIGSERQALNMSVHVTIHNLDEMDQDILARAQYVNTVPAELAKIKRLAAAGNSSAGQAAAGLDAIRAQLAQKKLATQREALGIFEKGLAAEGEGKYKVARIYYQMAARRAEGELKGLIEQRISLVDARLSARPGS